MRVAHARRDPVSNAVVFTDTRKHAAARLRSERSRQIEANENELNDLRSKVDKLTGLVTMLLESKTKP